MAYTETVEWWGCPAQNPGSASSGTNDLEWFAYMEKVIGGAAGDTIAGGNY
ncbi:MAG: hypothetical protein ACR2JR_11720 [Rubrobacteraceae bacterium]|jgi:hypothetical protein|nr:hypothetical protein [Actinomycetota bacterium]